MLQTNCWVKLKSCGSTHGPPLLETQDQADFLEDSGRCIGAATTADKGDSPLQGFTRLLPLLMLSAACSCLGQPGSQKQLLFCQEIHPSSLADAPNIAETAWRPQGLGYPRASALFPPTFHVTRVPVAPLGRVWMFSQLKRGNHAVESSHLRT